MSEPLTTQYRPEIEFVQFPIFKDQHEQLKQLLEKKGIKIGILMNELLTGWVIDHRDELALLHPPERRE